MPSGPVVLNGSNVSPNAEKNVVDSWPLSSDFESV